MFIHTYLALANANRLDNDHIVACSLAQDDRVGSTPGDATCSVI